MPGWFPDGQSSTIALFSLISVATVVHDSGTGL